MIRQELNSCHMAFKDGVHREGMGCQEKYAVRRRQQEGSMVAPNVTMIQ